MPLLATSNGVGFTNTQNSDTVGRPEAEIAIVQLRRRPISHAIFAHNNKFEIGDKTFLETSPFSIVSQKMNADGQMYVAWQEQRQSNATAALSAASGSTITVANTNTGNGNFGSQANRNFLGTLNINKFNIDDIVVISLNASTNPATVAEYGIYRISSINRTTGVITLTTNTPIVGPGTLTIATVGGAPTNYTVWKLSTITDEGGTPALKDQFTTDTAYNFVQNFIERYDLSDSIANQSAGAGLKQIDLSKMRALNNLLQAFERQALFGIAAGGTIQTTGGGIFSNIPNTNTNMLMGGLANYTIHGPVGQNFYNFGTVGTERDLSYVLSQVSSFSGGSLVILGGSRFIDKASSLIQAKQSAYSPTEDKLGGVARKFMHFFTPTGHVVCHEPEMDFIDQGKYSGSAFVINPDLIKFRPYDFAGANGLQTGDLVEMDIVYAQGQTRVGGAYRIQGTMEIAKPEAHAFIHRWA
jgi:hypothetical protein